jgi:predicted ATP-grasp superfamily ATP-dependent carboligase
VSNFSCLVVHARRTAYGLLRSLAPYSNHLYCSDVLPTPIKHSRYCKKFFIHKPVQSIDPSLLVETFKGISLQIYRDSGCVPFVFTGSDDYLQFFVDNYGKLSSYFHFSFVTDSVRLRAILSKKELAIRAREYNVPIPLTFNDDSPFSEIIHGLSFPIVLKPAIKASASVNYVDRCFRLKICNSLSDLESGIALLKLHHSEFVAQEFVDGADDTLFTLGISTLNGKILGWSTSRKIRQFPPSTGECSLGTLVHLPLLVDLIRPLVEDLSLSGIAQVEFKYSNGCYYLIEINPRIWSWFEIHICAGVNLALIFIESYLDPRRASFSKCVGPRDVQGVYWGFALIDLLHNHLLAANITLYQWVRTCFMLRIEAFFTLRDPVPFLIHLFQTIFYIHSMLRGSKK